MPLYEFEGKRPKVDPSAWVAPSADIIGEVEIGAECYVGWGAVLRADHGRISLGPGSAVEEGAVIHTSPDSFCRLGRSVTVGHGAMLHGAVLDDFCVVGMHATIANYGRVGEWTIVGEMGLVLSRQEVPARVIAVGQPVKVIGPLEERHQEYWRKSKERYRLFVQRNQKGLRLIPSA